MTRTHIVPFAWIMGLDTIVALMMLMLTIPIFLDTLPPILQKTHFTQVLLESHAGQIALIEQQATTERMRLETSPITATTEAIGGRYTLSTQLIGNTYTIYGIHPENNRSFVLSLTPLVVQRDEPTGSIQWLYSYNGMFLYEKSYPFSF